MIRTEDRYVRTVLEVEGVQMNARVRQRTRREVSKARDTDRRAAREFIQDREYA